MNALLKTHSCSRNFSRLLPTRGTGDDRPEPRLIGSIATTDLYDGDFYLKKMRELVEDDYLVMPDNIREPDEILNWLRSAGQ
ncbi:hypothetical protein AB9V76_003664 [Salmonella enterica]